MKESLAIEAPAKVNLYLRIVGRREDGYHLLSSLMQKIALCDTLELVRTQEPGIRLHCSGNDNLPGDEKNIVYRAAELFFCELGNDLAGHPGIRIDLRKKIPVAAGLGGGSSDAAAVLVGLDRMFKTDCGQARLAKMALRLGADVPLFIYKWPAAWATGIGECLSPAEGLKDGWLLLVNPDFPVSTKWVYENFALTAKEKKINLKNSHCNTDYCQSSPFAQRPFHPDDLLNDLEQITALHHREINEIKEQLCQAGATGSLMSGSGPTVFGIFSDDRLDKALLCRDQFLRKYKQVYLVRPLGSRNS